MDKHMQQAERLCRALADATRLRILALLARGEVCVCDLHQSLGISQPKASRHLGHLRRAGLVETRREGLWVHYRLVEAADPFVTGLVEAVTRALTAIPTVQRDARKLEKATGCDLERPAVTRLHQHPAGTSSTTAPRSRRTRHS
jgi:ArsR family transcriptional regulator, arsenate/arsenite/antimonite-responsive transcriptional repressor